MKKLPWHPDWESGKEDRCSLGLHYRADRVSPVLVRTLIAFSVFNKLCRVCSFVSKRFMMRSSGRIKFVAVSAGEWDFLFQHHSLFWRNNLFVWKLWFFSFSFCIPVFFWICVCPSKPAKGYSSNQVIWSGLMCKIVGAVVSRELLASKSHTVQSRK